MGVIQKKKQFTKNRHFFFFLGSLLKKKKKERKTLPKQHLISVWDIDYKKTVSKVTHIGIQIRMLQKRGHFNLLSQTKYEFFSKKLDIKKAPDKSSAFFIYNFSTIN
ncbi:MAG: hypothetical protein IPG90_08055 [Bacteroidetes bacterium]|nr:hypothetical protein [Bacteroidota bacterium]